MPYLHTRVTRSTNLTLVCKESFLELVAQYTILQMNRILQDIHLMVAKKCGKGLENTTFHFIFHLERKLMMWKWWYTENFFLGSSHRSYFTRRNCDADKYIRECLKPYVLPFMTFIEDNVLLMQNNVRSHKAGMIELRY